MLYPSAKLMQLRSRFIRTCLKFQQKTTTAHNLLCHSFCFSALIQFNESQLNYRISL